MSIAGRTIAQPLTEAGMNVTVDILETDEITVIKIYKDERMPEATVYRLS